MAIYSPYNTSDNYYSPYENTQNETVGLGQMLFSTAKTMAVFGLLNAAGRIGSRYLSTKAATFVRTYGTGRIAEAARASGAKTLGAIFKQTGPGKTLSNIYAQSTKTFRTALAEKDAYVSQVRRTVGANAAAVSGFKSSFKDFRTFAGSVGRLWKNTVWSGAGVAYAIDSFAGITRSYGIEPKPWYDVPGQIGNFGRWLAVDSVFSMGFGAATKLAKYAGAGGVSALRNTYQGSLGPAMARFINKVSPKGLPAGMRRSILRPELQQELDSPVSNYQQQFVNKGIHKTLAIGKTVFGSVSTLNTMVREMGSTARSALKEGRPVIKSLTHDAGPIRAALRQVQDIWKHAKETRKAISPVSHPGLNALEFADDLASRLASGSRGGKNFTTEILNEYAYQFRATTRANRKKTTLTDEVFTDLRRVQNKDVVNQDWVARVEGNLRHGGASNTAARNFMDSLLNMQAGIHMYKPRGNNISGGGIDLGWTDPLYMARKALNFALNRNVPVPFTNIGLNFSDLFQTHLFSESPKFAFFRENEAFNIGKNAKGRGFELDAGIISTSELAENAWFTTYSDATRSFSIVGPDGIKTIRTNNRIIALAPGSSYKQQQEARLEQAILKKRGQYVDPVRKPSRVGNKYVDYFIDKSELELPGMVQRLHRRVIAGITGRNHEYIDAGKKAFVQNPKDWYRDGDIVHSLKEQLGQDLFPLMKTKGFWQMLYDGSGSGATQFGDTLDVMINNRSLLQKLRDAQAINMQKDNWVTQLNKRGVAEAVELIRARPSYAQAHVTVKGMGGRTELTAYDQVRISMVEARMSDLGKDIPFLDQTNLNRFINSGAITKEQAKKLSLYSKLLQFTNTGMFDRKHGINPTPEVTRAVAEVKKHAHDLNWDMDAEITDYVKGTRLRRAFERETRYAGTEASRSTYLKHNSPYVSVGRKPGAFFGAYAENVVNNVTDMLHDTVFPFRKNPSDNLSIGGNLKYLAGGVAKIAGTMFAFKALDAFVAANPLFDETAFESGLTGFLADNVARIRLGQARVFDALGITGVAKHLNGLLPGFTTSAPGALVGAVVSRTLGGGPLGMMKGFAVGAIGNRLLSPYLPDFTKSYDQLEAEYQGKVEVPMMKSPTWLLGATPWEGSKVIGYQPNWYVRTKSRWKETDTLYGSTLRKLIHEPIPFVGLSIGDFVDPYYMERKHYFSRPYPETGEWGKEVPLVGPLIAGTLGRIFKPKKTMHQEFLTGPADLSEDSVYPFAIQPPTVAEGQGMMYHTQNLRTMGGRSSLMGNFVYGGDNKMWAHVAGEDFLEVTQNFAGLPGFMAGTVKDKLVNAPMVLPTLETAGRMASMTRSYFDMNLGGMGVFTEPVRRLIDKPDYKRYGINPIPNMMPNWLPQEFLTGDPYSRIMKGELRLPGKAYQVTHRIKRSMPARASMIGAPEEHQIQYFTGLLPPLLKEEYDIMAEGTTAHERIQDMLASEGLLVQAEAVVQDVKNDITGHVDAIIRDGQGGRGRKALEIKTINDQAFSKQDGPKYEHVGQLNFYLKQLKMREGVIMYINRENPAQVKTYTVHYSESRWQKDLRKLQKARQVTADLMREGMDDQFGYSYSWLDRLNILADVAPNSPEFKEAKFFVENQIKYGQLSEEEISKYKKALSHRQTRIRRYELYPSRFKGKVFSPDTRRNLQSINEDIKAAAEYSLPERIIGSIWERFTNSNNFLSNKLFAFKDPLEHYKMLQLYNKEYKPWDEVYGSFVEPTMRTMLGQTDPLGGAYKWALPGYVLTGGPFGALAGGVLGAAYGTVHGLFRAATDSAYIPGNIQERREIEAYFDAAKYERNQRAADLSQGLTQQEYLKARDATLTAFNSNGQDVANLFRGTPYMEKPYIEPWLNISNKKERQEVLKYIPKELATALKKQWSMNDRKSDNTSYNKNSSEAIARNVRLPAFDRSILDPSIQLEDIKLKTVEEAGFNSHDFGLGWNQQLYRVMGNYDSIKAANIDFNFSEEPNINPGQVRQALTEMIRSSGLNGNAQVYINRGASDTNVVNVSIRRDRALSIRRALDYREKYYG